MWQHQGLFVQSVEANDGPGLCRLKEMRDSWGKTQALALTLTYMTDVY